MNETDLPTGKFFVTERATLRMAESNMSNYRNAEIALLDLVDNAVDNRIEGKVLTIRVTVSRDTISIFNQGGEGLDKEGLENFLNWGHSEKNQRQIGQYGVGGKSAMGALGRSIEVRCSPKDSNIEYRFEDKDWTTKPEESEKQHTGEARRTEVREGYFRVTISNTKKRIDQNNIAKSLGEIYRPLLVNGDVEILVNGKKVEPLEIRYLETDPNFEPITKFPISGWGDEIPLKAGILAERDASVQAGFRLYYRGRLIIKGDFLGHDTPATLPQASRFVAEASLDFVGITTNKSDFIDDLRYEDAIAVLKEATRPLVEKLHSLKIEQTNQVEKYEITVAKEAKKAFLHILNHNPELLNRNQISGEARGRLPATPRSEPYLPANTGRSVSSTEGATAPDLRATAGVNVKRWGAFTDWEPVSMGIDEVACEVIEVSGNREALKVNIDYPLYQAQKMAGDDTLEMYILKIAISEIAKKLFPESLDEYLTWVQKADKHVGTFYAHRLSNLATRRIRR